MLIYSVYENPESGEYEFINQKYPTLKYRWIITQGKEFRDNSDLDTSGVEYK